MHGRTIILSDITLPLFGSKGRCFVPCANFCIAALTHSAVWSELDCSMGRSETLQKTCVKTQHQEDGLLVAEYDRKSFSLMRKNTVISCGCEGWFIVSVEWKGGWSERHGCFSGQFTRITALWEISLAKNIIPLTKQMRWWLHLPGSLPLWCCLVCLQAVRAVMLSL